MNTEAVIATSVEEILAAFEERQVSGLPIYPIRLVPGFVMPSMLLDDRLLVTREGELAEAAHMAIQASPSSEVEIRFADR